MVFIVQYIMAVMATWEAKFLVFHTPLGVIGVLCWWRRCHMVQEAKVNSFGFRSRQLRVSFRTQIFTFCCWNVYPLWPVNHVQATGAGEDK